MRTAYLPRTPSRVPCSVALIATEPGTRIKSLSMRVGFPEWIYSLGCPGTAEDRSKERILRVLEQRKRNRTIILDTRKLVLKHMTKVSESLKLGRVYEKPVTEL